MKSVHLLLCVVLSLLASKSVLSDSGNGPNGASWLGKGPVLEKSVAAFEVPIEVFATKIYLPVTVAGKLRRFVFDTGSPSMIDKRLADELALEIIGSNTGMDAHGTQIRSDVVKLDVNIGGVKINHLAMMTADFSGNVATRAFIGDGVIGSDVLPLGSWQIDLQASVIRFNTDLAELPHIKQSKSLKLHQFGYPYMPIFDVSFSKKSRSKALFDTGSPSYFAIATPDLLGAKKDGAVGRVFTGFGSPGASLGGQAPFIPLEKIELKSLRVDNLKLGKLIADGRLHPPSLIGAKLTEKYIVTLDSKTETAFFKEYSDSAMHHASFGFAYAFDGKLSIGAVWDNSPAKVAGLSPGITLTAINGVEVTFNEKGMRQALSALKNDSITLTWDKGEVTLQKQHSMSEPF